MKTMVFPQEIGSSVYGEWRFDFSLVHTSADGSLTGTARIFQASKLAGMVASSEASSSTDSLLEHLTSRCKEWIAT